MMTMDQMCLSQTFFQEKPLVDQVAIFREDLVKIIVVSLCEGSTGIICIALEH